jgi:hypothetical protein
MKSGLGKWMFLHVVKIADFFRRLPEEGFMMDRDC